MPGLKSPADHSRRPSSGWRPATAVIAVACVLLAISVDGRSVAAQRSDATKDAHRDDSETALGPVWGAAPSWPFQGVVTHVGSDGGYLSEEAFRPALETGVVGLGFHDSVTGEVSYVRAAGSPWFCHGGVMLVDSDGIVWDYSEYDSDRRWTVWVPWGDYGYPLFVRPHDANWNWMDLGGYVWPSRTDDRVQFGPGVGDLPLTFAGDEAIGMATPDGSSFYLVSFGPIEDRFRAGDWIGGLPRFVIDGYYTARDAAGTAGLAFEEYFTFDEGAGPQSWSWWPETVPEEYFEADDGDNEGWFGTMFAGTDGRFYGVTIRFDEPACGGNLTYVVDAGSGEVVTCGWSWVGPLLVAPRDAVDSSFVPALPDPKMGVDYGGGCSRVLGLDKIGAVLGVRGA